MDNAQTSAVNTAISFLPSSEESSKFRYSDEELNEFRKIVQRKLQGAEAYAASLKESLSGMFGEKLDTSRSFKPYEDPQSVYQKEETEKALSEQEALILKLRAASVRIENKTYGICRETGQLIPKERLRAVPHATLSIQGKKEEKKLPQKGSRR